MTSGVPPPAPARPSPIPAWSLADLIDFEVLLGQNDGVAETPWREAWDKRRADVGPGVGIHGRRTLFRAWLELRREQATTPLPGEAIATGWRWLGTLGAVVGIFLGASLTGALLHYQGSEPVNVAWFLACTLGLQWLLLLGAVALGLLRRTAGVLPDFQPLHHLLSGLAWLCSTGLRRLPGEQRENLRARLALLSRKREIYGSITTWPILVVTQLVAVGYNLGILGILLAHVAATDLAFGWQSTLDLSPEVAHRIVSAVAAPWAWFAGNAHPSLAQIVGSRFSYTDGIAVLDRSSLASWWPFLAYSVAFYGLFVRGGLLAFAAMKLRRTIRALAFDHEGCNALARQLSGPIIHTQGDYAALHIPDAAPPAAAPPSPGRACLALIAAELGPSPELARRLLMQAFGLPLAAAFPVQIDHPSGNTDALQAIAVPQAAPNTVVIIAPAHRAPIKAIALFLQKITEAAGRGREVILLLTGRQVGDGFDPVPEPDFQHWRNLIAVHHLPISLERLPNP